MSRPVHLSRVAAIALSAVLASGCGTGLHAVTYTEHGREDGATANLGGLTGIAIRNLHILPPTSGLVIPVGATAEVTGGLVNDGAEPDALIGASSDAAGSVQLTLAGTPTSSVPLPPQDAAIQDWTLVLSNLNRPLLAATYVNVTLDFQRAGRITLQVPVRPGDSGLASRTPEQNPYAEK